MRRLVRFERVVIVEKCGSCVDCAAVEDAVLSCDICEEHYCASCFDEVHAGVLMDHEARPFPEAVSGAASATPDAGTGSQGGTAAGDAEEGSPGVTAVSENVQSASDEAEPSPPTPPVPPPKPSAPMTAERWQQVWRSFVAYAHKQVAKDKQEEDPELRVRLKRYCGGKARKLYFRSAKRRLKGVESKLGAEVVRVGAKMWLVARTQR